MSIRTLYWLFLIKLTKFLSPLNSPLSWWIADLTGLTDRLSYVLGYDIRLEHRVEQRNRARAAEQKKLAQ